MKESSLKLKALPSPSRKAKALASSKELAGNNGFSLISSEKLQALYGAMLKGGKIARHADRLFKLHGGKAVAGREAAAAGVVTDLRVDDTLLVTHSNLVPAFLKGVPLDEFLRHQAGLASKSKARGPSAGKDWSSFNAFVSPVGAEAALNIANGLALAKRAAHSDGVVAIFLDPINPKDVQGGEALQFACNEGLPILIVIWSQSLSRAKNSGYHAFVHKAETCGIPRIAVDGTDVVAVYRVAFECIARARQGRGPTLIECVADVPAWPGASTGKVKAASRRPADPLLKMEAYLDRKSLFNAVHFRKVAASFETELNAKLKAAKAARKS